MRAIEQLFMNTILAGISRQAIDSCSKWSEKYRVMGPPFPGPWRNTYHPWVNGMLDCEVETIVGQKAAQCTFTEVALNKALYYIDMFQYSVLYVLPAATPHAANFSKSRFDPALELSPHLSELFTDVKNVQHKRAGAANLFIRGSRSKTGLKSDPCPVMIFDEVEEMDVDKLFLAIERASGQLFKHYYFLSTPSHEDVGINKLYKPTDQRHFCFPCPWHSVNGKPGFIEWNSLDNLVITAEDIHDPAIHNSYYICPTCKHTIAHQDKHLLLADGIWVPQFENRNSAGFHINQFYTPTINPGEMATAVINAESDSAAEQELYNSKMGVPHTVAGGRVEETHIVNCIIDYSMQSQTTGNNLVTMGVDVGKKLHVEIDEWFLDGAGETTTADPNSIARPRIVNAFTVDAFEELDHLLNQYNVHFCVIDYLPETRKTLEFCNRNIERVRACFYARGVSAREISRPDSDPRLIHVNRTAWMDLALGRFMQTRIGVPMNIPSSYKIHVRTPIRHYEHDTEGNILGRWLTPESKADHHAHSRTYAEIAFRLACSLGKSQDTWE